MKFSNRTEEETAKAILTDGKNGKFWELIVESMQESKAFIQAELDREDLSDLSPELYKLQFEIFKAKKRLLEALINTPDNLVSWLGQPEEQRKNFDPYEN